MTSQQIVDILNGLLTAETRSLTPRLREVAVYVSEAAPTLVETIAVMAAEEQEHIHRLTTLILDLRGSPTPATASIEIAGLHFLDFHYLLPQVLQSKMALIAQYESAVQRIGRDERVASVLNRILDRMRRHVAALKKESGVLSPTGPASAASDPAMPRI